MRRRSTTLGRAWRLGALVILFVVALAVVTLALRAGQPVPASAPLPSLTPAPSEPTTVVVGGASAAGAGASKEAQRWTTAVSATLGWNEINQARTGAGITAANPCPVKARCTTFKAGLAEVVKASPQVVVVACDPVGSGAGPKGADVSAYFRTLRQALPDARIIGVGPWSAANRPKAGDVALDKSVDSAVRSVRGVYVSLLETGLVDESMTTGHGSELNDIGHQAVADRVVGALDGSKT